MNQGGGLACLESDACRNFFEPTAGRAATVPQRIHHDLALDKSEIHSGIREAHISVSHPGTIKSCTSPAAQGAQKAA